MCEPQDRHLACESLVVKVTLGFTEPVFCCLMSNGHRLTRQTNLNRSTIARLWYGIGKVGTVPDHQFARDVDPIGTSFASIVSENRARTAVQVAVHPPFTGPSVASQQSLARMQELFIQRAYQRVASEESAADNALSSLYRYSKRVFDISLAFTALLVFAPLMLVIAAAIRIDSPGPALFKQRRVGQNGRLFIIYKFRSMTIDAGARLAGIHKSETDSRVTRVGKFIRKTSLDELPQLMNVVLGQMSLVGPRPELPEIVLQRYEQWQYRRLSVPQGITGWWQVTGRGKKLLWKHTADDLYYADRASFWFDLKLLFMTIGTVLGRDGAF
jgi:lipopolysaccharide/colanic/teichoic acid biosynthesis glycosyltransferase